MRDNAEAAVHIFEGTHENPELIWNDGSREKVSTTVREMMLEYVLLCVVFGLPVVPRLTVAFVLFLVTLNSRRIILM